jgi:branched-chain amino acid transport system ATP-binding protein
LIEDLANDISIVLVEHDMDMVMRISDRITVLQDGCIISDGTPQEIRNNQQVKEAYLGKAA